MPDDLYRHETFAEIYEKKNYLISDVLSGEGLSTVRAEVTPDFAVGVTSEAVRPFGKEIKKKVNFWTPRSIKN
jgi:hypothetical protein